MLLLLLLNIEVSILRKGKLRDSMLKYVPINTRFLQFYIVTIDNLQKSNFE